MSVTAEELVKRTLNVASLPTLYTKVDEAINRQASGQLIVDLISEDTAMSARLLKFVNSAMFNFPKRIDTVSQAIAIIGTQQLRALILASSVMAMFKDIPAELIDMESFWRHSVAVGTTARVIASLRRDSNIEYYFLAGLLHDIGRLILFKEKPQVMAQALLQAREQQQLLNDVENEKLGFDHARVGGMLLKEWKLAPMFVEVASYHHKPTIARDFPEVVAIVHVADVIANSLAYGSSGQIYVPPLNEKAWQSITLSSDIIERIVVELARQYKIAVEFILGHDAGSRLVA
jgi:putative nucleotidyltransferase with HDIG domain